MAADITSLVVEVKSVGIKQTSQELSGLGTSAANAERRINSLIEATKKMNVANELAAKSTQSIVTRLREQDALLGNMAANSRAAGRGTADLAAAMTLLSTSLNLMNQNLQRADRSQRTHNESMREAHALARGLSGSMGALWLTYGNFAGMAVGLGIGASLKGIVTVGKDVEHTLEGIRVRGNETVESVDKIRQAVYDLGKGVYGPQEVAKAFEVLILAGLRAEQALSAVSSTLNLAVAGGVSIEKAASTLVSVGTAVGYTAEAYNRVGDIIAKTAALSMSSVESLSESFKSASSVASLYGLSLEDIGTSLGVLSNLGIKGTASGTALKNMYKELASESDKVKGTFKQIGIEMSDFKDAAGNFKPLLEVIQTLDQGLGKLSGNEEKLAIARISNERGLRLLTEALEQYRKKTGETTNALGDFQAGVTNSYGFMAMAAVQLSLTAESQMKSVVNSLKTGFAQAFAEIQPEVIGISQNLRDAFQSDGFKDGIRDMAQLFANLASAIANNLPIVVKLAEAFLLVKASFIVAAIWHTAAAGIAAVGAALTGAAAGAALLNTAMGALGIVIALATAAWLAYSAAQEESMKYQKDAENYNKGYIEGIRKEADELEKVNQKMREGLALKDAKKAVESDNSSMAMVQRNIDAVEEARKNVEKLQKKVDNPGFFSGGSFAKGELLKAKQALTRAEDAQRDATIQAFDEQIRLKMAAKDNDELNKLVGQAMKSDRDDPTTTLGNKPNIAAINDQYAGAIAKLNAMVKAAKKDILNFNDTLNDKLKAGEIGKLEVIRESTKNQLEEYAKIDEALKKQIDIASKGKNKTADVERFSGLQEANTEAIEQAKRKAVQETEVYISALRQDTAKEQVKQFEEEGNFVAAAALRWSTEYAPAVKAVQADFEKYGDTIPEIGERLKQLEELQASAMDSARVKELSKEYNVLALEIGNSIKGVQTASEDQGLVAMWLAAQDATEKYKASLPDLQAQLEKLKRFAMADDASTGDKKAYEEALSQQKSLAEKYKIMWMGVSKSISNSLSDAFGKGGKAAGGVLEAITKYHNTDNKSLGAKAQLYGDVAKSAQGFFSEGSKGYKLMGVASQAASAIEIASTLATIGPKVASGVASLFAQGGWAGFAGAAAFLAIMAGLGFSGGGSSSAPPSSEMRQKMNGTGSVLGDNSAKSDSIQRALDEIAKDSGLGLVHFNSMDKSLRQVVEGISGVSSLLVRGTTLASPVAADTMGSAQKFASSLGGSIGEKLTGGAMAKVIGSIFGGKKSVEDVGIKIDKGSLSELLKGVTASQYTDIKKKGGLFSSDKYSTETKGLGDEINNQFTMIIKGLSDTVVGAATTLGIGGKAFEDRLKTFAINIAEISTKDMTGEEISKALEAAFAKLGDDMAQFGVAGLENFQKVGEGYLETLARVANQLVQVQDVFAVLGKSMNTVGIAAVQSSQDFINLFGSIDKLTEATSYFVENFLTDADKLKPIQESLTKEMNRLGLSSTDTVEKFKNLVLAQDLNTKAGQEMYANLMNVAPAFITVAEASKKAEEAAADLADKRLSMLLVIADLEGNESEARKIVLQQRALELAAMDSSLRPLQERINLLNDEAKAIEAAKAKATKDFAVLQASVTASKTAAKSKYDAEASFTNQVINSLKSSNTVLAALSSALDSALTSAIEAVGAMSRSTAQAMLTDTLNIAKKSGKLPSADSMKEVLSVLSKDSSGSFSTLEDYRKDAGITAGKLDELNDITKTQQSDSERMLAQMQNELDLSKKAYDAEVAAYDSIISYAQLQLDAMNNNVLATKDLKSALAAFNASATAASSMGQANGTSVGTASATGAQITALYQSLLGRNPDAGGYAFYTGTGETASSVASSILHSAEYASRMNGSHATGADDIPFDNYKANLHKGEMVLPAAKAKNVAQGSDMEAIVAAIKELKDDNTSENQALVSDLRILRKLFQNLTPNGQQLQVTSTL